MLSVITPTRAPHVDERSDVGLDLKTPGRWFDDMVGSHLPFSIEH